MIGSELQESALGIKKYTQLIIGFVLGTVTSVLPMLYVPWETAEKKSILQHFMKSPPLSLYSSAQLSASFCV